MKKTDMTDLCDTEMEEEDFEISEICEIPLPEGPLVGADDVDAEQQVRDAVGGDRGEESEADRQEAVDDGAERGGERAVVLEREEEDRPEEGRQVEAGHRD